MRDNCQYFIHAFVLLMVLLTTGCASTEKLVDQKYVQGDYLRTEASAPTETRRETYISIDHNRVKTSEIIYYSRNDTNVYEKKLEQEYKREEGSDFGEVLMATMLTPLGLAGDAILLGGLLVGDFLPWTQIVWEDVVDTNTRYVTKVAVVPNEYVKETKSTQTSEQVALSKANVDVYLNKEKATTLSTDKNGVAHYNTLELLLGANIHPKDLIQGQGLKVTASVNNARNSITIPNSSIPDSYFSQKFRDLNTELMSRPARLDNCQTISQAYREIFECFYQR